MWPILQRELLVRGRSRTAWIVRVGIAGTALLLTGMVAFWLKAFTTSGSALFHVLFYALMLFCLVEGIRATAWTLPEERREGTLGLLFLTPLSSLAVLLGKTAAAALAALYTLIAVAPVLAIPLLLGGVTGTALGRAFAILVGALGLSLGCGALASVNSRDALTSLLRAGLGLFALVLIPAIALACLALSPSTPAKPLLETLGGISPLVAMTRVEAPSMVHPAAEFWAGQLGLWLLTAGLLALAARRLAATWRENTLAAPDVSRSLQSKPRPGPASAFPDGRELGHAPSARPEISAGATLSRAFSGRSANRRWVLAVAVATGLLPLPGLIHGVLNPTGTPYLYILPVYALSLLISLMVAQAACRAFAEARQSGELEILLTTPVRPEELVCGLWLALRPFAIWQAAAVVATQFLAFGVQAMIPRPGLPDSVRNYLLGQQCGWLFGSGLTTYLGAAALIWVGLWFGLTSRTTAIAVGQSLLLVRILTGMGSWFLLTMLQVTFGLGRWSSGSEATSPIVQFLAGLVMAAAMAVVSGAADLGWIFWARHRLRHGFRPRVSPSDAAEVPAAAR